MLNNKKIIISNQICTIFRLMEQNMNLINKIKNHQTLELLEEANKITLACTWKYNHTRKSNIPVLVV